MTNKLIFTKNGAVKSIRETSQAQIAALKSDGWAEITTKPTENQSKSNKKGKGGA